VIRNQTPGGTAHRKAIKKTRKKHKARMRLEQAWAWQAPGGLGAPWFVPPVRPLDRAEPPNAESRSWADAADLPDEAVEAVETADAPAPAGPVAVAYPDQPVPPLVHGASPEDRDLRHEASSLVERHDPASDPPVPRMRPEPLAVRGLNNGTPRAWTHQDGELARKTLLTAGPDAGSWVGAIAGTSDAPADITFNVYLGDGLADYLVGAATVPAGAGTGTIPAVNLLADATQLPWVSTEGSFTIPAGWQVRFENVTAPAAGTVTLVPFGGDY
jgi:hypothetical protein